MKYTIKVGERNEGERIPRILNPLVFLAAATLGFICLAFCALAMTALVVYAPFSWLSVVKIKRSP